MSSGARQQIQSIMDDPAKLGLQKQLKKAFRYLSQNPGHPGLNSHPIPQFDKIFDAKVFSSYMQNNTPQAHRILWVYGPKIKHITIVAVTPHY
ncbi:MAG TPA: hypothetical protein VJB34_00635 [Bdellovibrionota bacterium]|nr:hypothetical protein [Bdellovibrionota bacterium]